MLTRLVNIETLQRLQDHFAALGRVTVCMCTVEGQPITTPTWGSRFSELIGTSPLGRSTFCEGLHTSSTAPTGSAPCTCHDGITLYSTPIIHNSDRLAIITVGTRCPTPPPARIVRKMAEKYNVDPDALLRTVATIDPYSGGEPEAIHRFADTLAGTIATLYSQADRIERQFTDLRTVHGLSELFSGTSDLQEILDVTVRRVVEVMPVKACGIRLLNFDTDELVVQAVFNLSDAYLRKGTVTLHDNAIDAEAFSGTVVYIEDVPTDPRTKYPDNARQEGIVSGLCVPMTFRGHTVGVLRVYTASTYKFSKSEGALLRSIGSQAASAIINGRLYEERAETERFQRQVEAAGEIQRRMLPAEAPQHPGLEFGCVYEPTLKVGGDFYDFIELPEGKLGVSIADVVGKGLPAALLMASVRSALRANAIRSGDLDAIFDEVNHHMCRDTLAGEFATMVYGVFSADGRSFTYCNAGHPPPVVLRGDRFIELTTGGPVVGVLPKADFDHESITTQPGDILVMTTDGVIEAMSFAEEAYGRERLLSSILRHSSLDAQQLALQILWDVRRFVGLAEQSDDITILVVKIAG